MDVQGNKTLSRIAFLAVTLCTLPLSAGEDPSQAAVELQAKYAADIEQLAKWCEAKGLAEEAKKTRKALGPHDPFKLYMPVLTDAIGPPSLPSDAQENVVEWDSRLWKLRREQATALYDLARRAEKTGRAGLAFDLVLAAIQADPNNELARRLLGYQKFHDQWHTVYEVRKLRTGQVWSDKFGWLPKAYLQRYKDGQRLFDGRWISAEEDAEKHRDIRSGWDVETEHYTIRTNHSIEEAVKLGVKLERLDRLWQQLFIRYYASEADVAALFEGRFKPGSAAQQRHEVVLFRDREEYNRSLQAAEPKIGMTTGIYFGRMKCAYFFAGKESDDSNLYHEATHQLFYESRRVNPDFGKTSNFWIVEGIALFMESLHEEDGYYVLGGFDNERLHAAQYRLLEDKFFVPLAEFTDYGMEKLQADPRIATLYSQAAGLTHFLAFYDGGRYRDALVSYLLAVYTGRAGLDTLSKLTGESYEKLDKQYREFLEKGEGK